MIVLVVGTHESGADAVAALLHEWGVVMGEDGDLATGPDGRAPFENARFRLLNDRMAERRGYRIDSFRSEIPALHPGAITRLRMRRLTRSYDARHPRWGFSDPRTCLTLDSWLREMERIRRLERARVVYVASEPEASARALAERRGPDTVTALRLWKHYSERALAALDVWQPPTHYLSREDLERSPAATSMALARFVGASRDCISDRNAGASAASSGGASLGMLRGTPLGAAVLDVDERIRERVRASRRTREEGISR